MFKKILITIFGIIFGLYALFLLLPVISIPFLDKGSAFVSSEIEKATGFKSEFKEFRIVTTPKLTVGIKLSQADITQPDGKKLLTGKNAQVKMSLLPLFAKKIRADIVSADELNLDIYVKEDGSLLINDFFTDENNLEEKKEDKVEENKDKKSAMPFGLKFSNHMPDLRLKAHNITFIDTKTGKKYVLSGSNTNVTDFILNKKVKIESTGKLTLDNFEAFNYNVKVLNRVMPDIDINSLVEGEEAENGEEVKKEEKPFDIIGAFKAIKDNQITANLNSDIKVENGEENIELNGNASLNNVSVAINGKKLPMSKADFTFKKNDYEFDIDLYTAQNEVTKGKGVFKYGKNQSLSLNVKSNATLKNIFEIANAIALATNVNDLKTLSGKGQLDADFDVKTDFKTLTSNGYLKLNDGFVNYGLYGVTIDKLSADVKLDGNSVLINKLGFTTMGVPLVVTGNINHDTTCDIKIQTSSLPVKGLLVSLGQAAILKENPITSGIVTVLAKITGKLDAPKIAGDISINNLDLKNIPSDTRLVVNPVKISLNSALKGFKGNATAANIKAINPALVVSIPSAKADINENTITINPSGVSAGKNNFNLSGTISNYMTDKIDLNLNTSGNLKSNLTGLVHPNKMTLDLKYSIPTTSTVVIPGFDKSKVILTGNTTITGAMDNPILKGVLSVSSVEIPEVPVTMKNITTGLNGPILNGNASIDNFVSGGIKAENIKTDFKLAGAMFYLKNLTGSAFDGTFNGDISYNMASTKCNVKMNGEKMNATKAIEGAAGIKNALSGTLGFGANVGFVGVDYEDMIKSMTGSADFEVKNGVLGNLGNLNSLMLAQNIINNTLLKSSSSKLSGAAVAQSASEFDYIKGNLTFSGAYANLKSIKLSGPSMAYYITGTYQILNGSTNVVVLGRLSESIVSGMGNLGDLAVKKLTKIHPAFGNLTAVLLKDMNVSPNGINVNEIPPLRSQDTKYKDFKAVYNGNLTSKNSVKSFKWINDTDTSALETTTTTTTPVNISVDEAKKQAAKAASDILNSALGKPTSTTGENSNSEPVTKEQLKQQAKDLSKELLKSLLAPPATENSSGN